MSQKAISKLHNILDNKTKENLNCILGKLLTPYLKSFTDIRLSSIINSNTKKLSIAINDKGYVYIAPFNELIIKKGKNYTSYTDVGIAMVDLGYEIFNTK
jgi:hypothetical protein